MSYNNILLLFYYYYFIANIYCLNVTLTQQQPYYSYPVTIKLDVYEDSYEDASGNIVDASGNIVETIMDNDFISTLQTSTSNPYDDTYNSAPTISNSSFNGLNAQTFKLSKQLSTIPTVSYPCSSQNWTSYQHGTNTKIPIYLPNCAKIFNKYTINTATSVSIPSPTIYSSFYNDISSLQTEYSTYLGGSDDYTPPTSEYTYTYTAYGISISGSGTVSTYGTDTMPFSVDSDGNVTIGTFATITSPYFQIGGQYILWFEITKTLNSNSSQTSNVYTQLNFNL